MYYLVYGQMSSSATAVVSSANSKSTRRLMQSATPAPTEPENITCTEQNYFVSGDYNDELLTFYIQVTYPSIITIDARNSTADNVDDIKHVGIELVFPDGTLIVDGDNDPNTIPDQYPEDFLLLGVGGLDEGIYRMYYFMGYPPPQNLFGTFSLSVRCDVITTPSPTPAPTNPENITCSNDGSFTSGDYNDEILTFYINVTQYSNITIDLRNSTADDGNTGIIGLEFHFPDGSTIITDNDNDPGSFNDQYPDESLLLGVANLEKGIYQLYYFMGYPPPLNLFGTFALSVFCDANPTSSPTPAPTNPGNITCSNEGSFVSGDYNDELLTFYIEVVEYSNIIIDARNSTTVDGNTTYDFIGIQIEFPDGKTTIVDGDGKDQYSHEFLVLGVANLEKGDYQLSYFMGDSPPANMFGTFVMTIRCDAITTASPTTHPTDIPTLQPTDRPSKSPTTSDPTEDPTTEPTINPTIEPTRGPTEEPTFDPSIQPTESPTGGPTVEPTVEPTTEPSIEPTIEPTIQPTATIDLDSGTNRTVTFGSVLIIGMTIFFAVSVLPCICALSSRYFIRQKRIHQKPDTVDVPGSGADALKKGRTDLKVSVSDIGDSPTGIAGRLKEWTNVGKSSRNQYASVSTSDAGDSLEKTLSSIGTSHLKSSVKTGAAVKRIDELSPSHIGNSSMTTLLQPTAEMDTTRTANNILMCNIGNS